jgi:hypothetical protein
MVALLEAIGYSASTVPLGLIFPTFAVLLYVNQMLPSGPLVRLWGAALTGNSTKLPSRVMRPILLFAKSVNQIVRFGPLPIPRVLMPPPGTGNSLKRSTHFPATSHFCRLLQLSGPLPW